MRAQKFETRFFTFRIFVFILPAITQNLTNEQFSAFFTYKIPVFIGARLAIETSPRRLSIESISRISFWIDLIHLGTKLRLRFGHVRNFRSLQLRQIVILDEHAAFLHFQDFEVVILEVLVQFLRLSLL